MCATDQGVINAQWNAAELACRAEEERVRPSVLYRPGLTKDGDNWCALFGENIQVGVCGFGSTPAEAMDAFDKAWVSGT